MCVMCGDLITQVHWADRIYSGSDEAEVVVGDSSYRDNTRTRLLRVQFINSLVSFYGLSVESWRSSTYVIRDKKGNSKMATNLAEVWSLSEQLVERKIDILDPEFLSFVQQRGEV